MFQTWKTYVRQQQEMRNKYTRAEVHGEKKKSMYEEDAHIYCAERHRKDKHIVSERKITLGPRKICLILFHIFLESVISWVGTCTIGSLWFSPYGMVWALKAHLIRICMDWLFLACGFSVLAGTLLWRLGLPSILLCQVAQRLWSRTAVLFVDLLCSSCPLVILWPL